MVYSKKEYLAREQDAPTAFIFYPCQIIRIHHHQIKEAKVDS
ncbi:MULTISPECIES: hypothetical protein [Okeania]|nr:MULTISPECIES: hypothetical protein [Okeania]